MGTKTKSKAQVKKYSGVAGDYIVIADDGDNEFAINFCVAQMAYKGQPTLGVGVRLRYYFNDGDESKFKQAFPAHDHGGSNDDCAHVRIKQYIPIVHAAAGLLGLKQALKGKIGLQFLDGLADKIKKAGGAFVVDFPTFYDLLMQPLSGVPDKLPEVYDPTLLGTKTGDGVPLDATKVPPAPLGNSSFA